MRDGDSRVRRRVVAADHGTGGFEPRRDSPRLHESSIEPLVCERGDDDE